MGTCYPKELLPKVPLILKSFYDNDLLEEEALQEWADKVRSDTSRPSVIIILHSTGF